MLAEKAFGLEYAGRRLIGRDSLIRGGVYYGTYGGEAIVVDPDKFPEQYDNWYNLATNRASDQGRVQRNKVLSAVYGTVRDNMRYSQSGVEQLLAVYARRDGYDGFPDGRKLDLGVFMHGRVGVCRHQALAAGILLEKFKEAGHIRGEVSVDRNVRWNPLGDRGGHAWTRYTAYSGQVMILDVARDYFGSLEASVQRPGGWNYLRPEESHRFAAPELGRLALSESSRP